MDENIIKIVLAVITTVGAVLGGVTLYSRNKTKTRKNRVIQKDITITGDNNKVIGGDDKSGG